jgi:hypothetical protein
VCLGRTRDELAMRGWPDIQRPTTSLIPFHSPIEVYEDHRASTQRSSRNRAFRREMVSMSVKSAARLIATLFVCFVICGSANAKLCDPNRSILLAQATWLEGNGYAYRVDIPLLAELSNTVGHRTKSPLVLCEDGNVLTQKNANADQIVKFGAGRWDHFGPLIWFSSTDGSNPITNGKRYTIDSEQVDLHAFIASRTPNYLSAIAVLTPTILTLVVFAAFVVMLRGERSVPPFVDVGFWAAGTATAYLSLASLLYVMSGMVWTLKSDRRMFQIYPTSGDVAGMLWWGLAYVSILSAAYLLIRERSYPTGRATPPPASYGIAFACIIAFAMAWMIAVELRYGVSIVQDNISINTDPWTAHVPLLVAQITQHSFGILNIAKIAMVIWLVSHFDKPWAKVALAVWLPIELAMTLKAAGARTYFASLLIAGALIYHLRRRPFGVIPLVAVSCTMIVGLLGYGCWRSGTCSFDANTEFQTILANPIHLSFLISDGQVKSVPAGVRFAELLQFIPQQLSPFQKFEPSNWYGEVSGTIGSGTAFGVLAQSVAGLGFFELAVRAALLGLALAAIHNLCERYASRTLTTVFYIWLCITIYYAFRVGSFYWIAFIIWRFVPFAIAAWAVSKAIEFISLTRRPLASGQQ